MEATSPRDSRAAEASTSRLVHDHLHFILPAARSRRQDPLTAGIIDSHVVGGVAYSTERIVAESHCKWSTEGVIVGRTGVVDGLGAARGRDGVD